uniref:BPTI/Kunitz inhibitor domain-containing protein n=1 Tax=Neolamprologus brichardi TaxID=32507 RepID=A0A3Q4HLI3_NEOBR
MSSHYTILCVLFENQNIHSIFFLHIKCFLHYVLSHPTEFCRLPADAGQGTSFNFAVYYDVSKDQCSPFLYNGEGGNANRFQNERECLRNCSLNAENVYPMDAIVMDTLSDQKACHFKKIEGTCNGKYLRYYYDSFYDKCKRFLWTGCLGNGNRFFDFISCNSTCAGIHSKHTHLSFTVTHHQGWRRSNTGRAYGRRTQPITAMLSG